MSEIRPQTLDDFIGQVGVVRQLKVVVTASAHRQLPLPHMLFQGGPGLAKTTLAYSVLPHVTGREATYINCAAIAKPQDLLPTLTTRKAGEIVVLDEIHLLRNVPQMTEHMLSLLEDSKVTLTLGDGPKPELMTVTLPKFTILGTTTCPGMLSQPLRDRFRHLLQLEAYSDEEMAKILCWTAEKRDARLTPEAAAILVPACQGTARYAVRLIESAIEVSCCYDYLRLTTDVVREVLELQGIVGGLTKIQQTYLGYLHTCPRQQAGVASIAAFLDEDARTVESIIEPHLLRQNLIARNPSGRQLTDKGTQWLKEHRH